MRTEYSQGKLTELYYHLVAWLVSLNTKKLDKCHLLNQLIFLQSISKHFRQAGCLQILTKVNFTILLCGTEIIIPVSCLLENV